MQARLSVAILAHALLVVVSPAITDSMSLLPKHSCHASIELLVDSQDSITSHSGTFLLKRVTSVLLFDLWLSPTISVFVVHLFWEIAVVSPSVGLRRTCPIIITNCTLRLRI